MSGVPNGDPDLGGRELKTRPKKSERQMQLQHLLHQEPFLTDEELASRFSVSVQTIRLDRMALGIPEVRVRTRMVAEHVRQRVRALGHSDIIGDLLDIVLNESGISVLEATPDMTFENNDIVRGHLLFAQAESLALAIIDAPRARTGVVNVKYLRPVRIGERLVAKAQVIRRKPDGELVVLVTTHVGREPVFRGKFAVALT